LLAQVFAEIRAEWEARGKVAEFDRLKSLLLEEDLEGGFPAAARDLGTTDTALRMAGTRLRQRFRQVLRDTVAETTEDESVDDELRFLLAVLQR
jgi:RNA polymerase sigma-70 factor (ECF subfamily)